MLVLLRSIVKEAKSVDEAIKLACSELEIDIEDAEIEVLDEGNKGILGFIGNKNAVVKVTEKLNIDNLVLDFLEPILQYMDIEAEIEIEQSEEEISVNLTGENIGLIIGKRGRNPGCSSVPFKSCDQQES